MSSGWIKLHRSVMDNDLWQDKPFARGQAWIDLIMLANHKDAELWIDGICIQIKRGEFVTSIRKLSERWGWSRTKTKRFLDELKTCHMLVVNCDTKKTTIKVLNYNKYQGLEDLDENKKATEKATEVPPKSHRKATEKPQKDTNKNIKNIKNVKKEKEYKEKEPAALSFSEEDDDDFDPVWEDPKVLLEQFRKEQER